MVILWFSIRAALVPEIFAAKLLTLNLVLCMLTLWMWASYSVTKEVMILVRDAISLYSLACLEKKTLFLRLSMTTYD